VKIPQWYIDGKFGIFVQYGVYAVPAFGNEDYPRAMYWETTPTFAHHVKTYGPQNVFGYKDFIPQFTAAQFNASRLADLFKSAGARYVVVVAEHADGFPMYDCSLTDWSAVKMGPKRDILGELASAIRSRNIVFGAASHRG
jgi:alpha-L-fucosidase